MISSASIFRLISMIFVALAALTACATEPVAAHFPTVGLVAYYPFEGDARDASGNGNHGYVYGAMLADDKFGNTRSSYYLDGQNDHMVAPVNISPSVMPLVTMVVWAKAEQADRIATIFSNATSNRRSRMLLMRSKPGSGGCWATSTNSSGSWVWDEVETGEWTFLAVSFNQSSKKLHLQVDDRRYEADCSQRDGHIDLNIGKNPLSGEYFHGCLDEIRVYDRILNKNEVAALYRQFQNGQKAKSDHEVMLEGGRRGLMFVFITGFSLFAGTVLAANIMIRRKSMAG